MNEEKANKDGLQRIPTKIIRRMLAIARQARQEPWDLSFDKEDGSWRIDFRNAYHPFTRINQGFDMLADQADAMHVAAAQPAVLIPLLEELLFLRNESQEESKIILP